MIESVTSQLSLHGKLTYLAHLFKALIRKHHLEYLPILKSSLSGNSIIIDVGAHSGQFTKLFSTIVPAGKVYAFEPGSYASSILKKVIGIYRLKNVTHVNKGLGEQCKKECLIIPVKKSGSLLTELTALIKRMFYNSTGYAHPAMLPVGSAVAAATVLLPPLPNIVAASVSATPSVAFGSKCPYMSIVVEIDE